MGSSKGPVCAKVLYTHYPAYHVSKLVISMDSEALYYFKGFRIYVFCLINEQCRCEFLTRINENLDFLPFAKQYVIVIGLKLSWHIFRKTFSSLPPDLFHLCACNSS